MSNDTFRGYHPIALGVSLRHDMVWGYTVMKQTRGKRQRYSLYEARASGTLLYTRIARDLKHDDARGMLRVLLACASND